MKKHGFTSASAITWLLGFLCTRFRFCIVYNSLDCDPIFVELCAPKLHVMHLLFSGDKFACAEKVYHGKWGCKQHPSWYRMKGTSMQSY